VSDLLHVAARDAEVADALPGDDELLDLLTIAGLAAGLRERVGPREERR
jgi:hypothetical protein